MKSSLELWDMAAGMSRVVLQTAARIEAPNWSPCGTYLMVNSDGRLFKVPLSDPKLVPLDTGFANRCNNDHGISPDGKTIALSHHRENGAEIFLIPAAGGTPRVLSLQAPSWWHGWSPDGARITYAAARGSRGIDIYTMPVAGGSESRLTMGEGQSDGPDYSAGGSHIYYNCDRSGHAQIWVMAADGSGQRHLFKDDHVLWFPHPSPCGRHLICLAYPPGTPGHPRDLAVEIWIMAPDGSGRRSLLAFTGGQGTMNVPNWRADGGAFAFVRYTA
ncbi:MAG: hypothetical protein V4712_05205 [Pseudomonadota bacterium]